MGCSQDRAAGPARRRGVALAGHAGDAAGARLGLQDPDPSTRAIALTAVARAGGLTTDDVLAALSDDAPSVRRRGAEVAAATKVPVGGALLARLGDRDATVAEVAAWALGELGEDHDLPDGALAALGEAATGHADALVREAAVAALGAIGDPAGLPAILAGTADKPAVRRRAMLALAPFDGPEVDEAIARGALDRDWQVRDAAELLLADRSG